MCDRAGERDRTIGASSNICRSAHRHLQPTPARPVHQPDKNRHLCEAYMVPLAPTTPVRTGRPASLHVSASSRSSDPGVYPTALMPPGVRTELGVRCGRYASFRKAPAWGVEMDEGSNRESKRGPSENQWPLPYAPDGAIRITAIPVLPQARGRIFETERPRVRYVSSRSSAPLVPHLFRPASAHAGAAGTSSTIC